MARIKTDLEALSKKVSFDPLPDGFVVAKPIKPESYDEETIYQLEKLKRLIVTRKRNGWKIFGAKSAGKWKLYTDGLKEIHSLDHIKEALNSCGDIPDNTLIVGEGIVPGKKDLDVLSAAQSVFGSSAERSAEVQKKLGLARFRLFDILFWNGDPLCTKMPYVDRLIKIIETFGDGAIFKDAIVSSVEQLNISFDEAKELAKKNKWEGLVLYDADFRSSFRLDGKSPERIKGCYKWKPLFEDDFIAYEPVIVDGKLKEVRLSQIDEKTGKQFDCGKCGGLTKKKREEFMARTYPFVIEISYEFRFPTGKLQNKRFLRNREDKKVSDCTTDSQKFPKAIFL